MFLAIPKTKGGLFYNNLKSIEILLLKLAFFNLLLVSLLGVALRSYSFITLPFNYKNLLHGHSHFAFSGWIMPLFMWLIIRYFPAIAKKVSVSHWRSVVFINFFSAYGMLVSFPFQGYGVVSIIFSTVSVGTGFYLAIILWKAAAGLRSTSVYFLKAGLVCLVISAIGPLATGPLIAIGMQGTPLYYNAIYFYLHFQYNGWFIFLILGLLYTVIERNGSVNNGKKVFWIMIICCVPAYFLSTLWNQPHLLFYVIGGMAALGQMVALFYFITDLKFIKEANGFLRMLFILATCVFIVKNFLQLLSAFPYFADMAYQNRDLVIAYLHLVLLGFISLVAIILIMKENVSLTGAMFKVGLACFLFSFVVTETLLVFKPFAYLFGIEVNFNLMLLLSSCIFPVSVLLMYREVSECRYRVQSPIDYSNTMLR